MSDLVILSPVFYDNAAYSDLMVASARAHGLNVRLFGIGEPFIPHGADAQVLRLALLMSEGKIADHVLVTDCRDVLFLAGEEEIMQKFYQFDSPLVMSTEKHCWPPDPEIVAYFWGKGYINAGQYIGKWEHVEHCLKFLLDNYRGQHPGADNSQGWWMWAKMRHQLKFALDTRCQIFQSMDSQDHDIIAGAGRAKNVRHNTFPCSLHFNGNPGTPKPHEEMYRRLFK